MIGVPATQPSGAAEGAADTGDANGNGSGNGDGSVPSKTTTTASTTSTSNATAASRRRKKTGTFRPKSSRSKRTTMLMTTTRAATIPGGGERSRLEPPSSFGGPKAQGPAVASSPHSPDSSIAPSVSAPANTAAEGPSVTALAEVAASDEMTNGSSPPLKRDGGGITATVVVVSESAAAGAKAKVDPSDAPAPAAEAPSTTSAPALPSAPLLASYCSKYRTKRRKRSSKEARQSSPLSPPRQQQQNSPVVDEPAAGGGDGGGDAPREAATASVPTGPAVQIVNGEIVLQPGSNVVGGGVGLAEMMASSAAASTTVGRTHGQQLQMEVLVEHEQHLAIVGASYASYLDPRRRRDDDGDGDDRERRRGGEGGASVDVAAGGGGGRSGAGGVDAGGSAPRTVSATAGRRPLHWDDADTRIFYDSLRQVGTDFNLMKSYFDGRRSRRQLKRKYQSELVRNPELVERALHPGAKKRIDLTVFQVSEEDLERSATAAAATAANAGPELVVATAAAAAAVGTAVDDGSAAPALLLLDGDVAAANAKKTKEAGGVGGPLRSDELDAFAGDTHGSIYDDDDDDNYNYEGNATKGGMCEEGERHLRDALVGAPALVPTADRLRVVAAGAGATALGRKRPRSVARASPPGGRSSGSSTAASKAAPARSRAKPTMAAGKRKVKRPQQRPR